MAARMVIAVLCLLALNACGAPATGTATVSSSNGAIEISNAWVRPMEGAGTMDHSTMQGTDNQPTSAAMPDMDMTGVSSTAYMTIRNTGSADDRLLKVSTDAAMSVELHNNTDANGVMSMNQVQTVTIPAGGTVEFKPTALHIMLIGLKYDLHVGDTVALTLQFEHAGTIMVNAPVQEQ